jgi:hypothetical protein
MTNAPLRLISRHKCTDAFATKNVEFAKESDDTFSVVLKNIKYQGQFDGEINQIKEVYWLMVWFSDVIVFTPNGKINKNRECMKWYSSI